MTTETQDSIRLGVLTELVRSAPKPPGRTALMKFAYLLQAVRGVPLGYRFRLYTYGPYDEQVLADARIAAQLGFLKSELVTYPSGYGYQYAIGEDAGVATHSDYDEDVQWVLSQFGHESASRLELISTLIFELCDKSRRLDSQELVRRVREIKPHFSVDEIQAAAGEISAVLECVTCK